MNDPLSKFTKADLPPIDLPDIPTSEDDALWEKLIALADQLSPQVQQGFTQSIESMKSSSDSAKFLAALKDGDSAEAFLSLLSLEGTGLEAIHTLQTGGDLGELGSAFENMAYEMMSGVADSNAFNVDVAFNPGSPQVSQFINDYVLGQVKQITEQQRALLTSKIVAGLNAGKNPIDIAREIKPYIGLTDNQADAVDNFRGLLESNDPASLTRELRDKRYDPTIRSALSSDTPLESDVIDTMVGRYADLSLKHRAQTIARTETLNALHQSQNFLWQQAADSGAVMGSDLYRYWHVAHDERTCPICKPIPSMNPDGVSINGQFQTPVGAVDGPTMHPNCRCVVFTRPHISSLYNTDPSQLVDEIGGMPDDEGDDDDTEKSYRDPLSKFAKGAVAHDVSNEPRNADGEWATDGSGGADPKAPLVGSNSLIEMLHFNDSLSYGMRDGSAVRELKANPDSEDVQKLATGIYSGSGFRATNAMLRGASLKDYSNTETDVSRALVPVLDKAIDATAPLRSSKMLYRGISQRAMSHDIKFTVGDTFTDDGYVSTSQKLAIAQQGFADHFGGETAAKAGVMIITMPKGSHVLDVAKTIPESNNIGEKEFIVPRSSQFKITEIDDRNPMFQYIHAKWIGVDRSKSVIKSDRVTTDDNKFVWGAGHLKKVVSKSWFDVLEDFTKFNHNHDPKDGEFSSGDSSGGGKPITLEQKHALDDYVRSGYHDLSALLRHTSYTSMKNVLQAQTAIQHIDSAFDSVKPLAKPITVYRGMTKTIANQLALKQGSQFTDLGFISTSLNPSMAERFGLSWGYAKITVPAGTKVLNINSLIPDNSHRDEEEIILPRGSVLRVDSLQHSKTLHEARMKLAFIRADRKPIPKDFAVQKIDAPSHKFVWDAGDLHESVAEIAKTWFDVLEDFTKDFNTAEPRNRIGEWTDGSGNSPAMLAVEHYSPLAGLTTLDPRKSGSGRVGRERQRSDRIPAVHVYDSKHSQLEDQFRHDYRYTGQVPTHSIYDIGRDPDKLIPATSLYDATQLERKIKAKGYTGFRNSQSSNPSIIKLFYPLNVTPAQARVFHGKQFGALHPRPQRSLARKSFIFKIVAYLSDPLSRF